MHILYIKHFFVGFMVSDIPMSVFGYFPLYMLRNILFYVLRRDNLECFRCLETSILDVSVVSRQEIVSHLDH